MDKLNDNKVTGPAAIRFYAPNQWPNPADLPDFRSAIDTYFEEMSNLAKKMFYMFHEVLIEFHYQAIRVVTRLNLISLSGFEFGQRDNHQIL